MKKVAFLGTLAMVAALAQAQPYATWSRARSITIDASAATGANVAGNVNNFPVLIRLSNVSVAAGANVLTEALTGGADLRFTDSTGMTALPYEIESWGTASAAVWVKVPVVTGNAVTKIRMFWGKASQTSLSSASAVFDTANGYTGVWHLGEGSGATTVADATVNGLSFTGDAGVVSVPGVAGDARYYNQGKAGTNEYAIDEAAHKTQFDAKGAATAITMSAWVNRQADGSSASQGVFGNFRYSAGAFRSYALMRNVAGNFNVLTSVDGSGDTRRVSTSATFANNTWTHVVATINPAGAATPVIRLWVNGVAQATTGTNTTGANAAVFASTSAEAKPLIGALERANSQGTESFIDEVEFSNGVIRDSNWIKLSYETQKPGSAVVALGATEAVPAKALFYPLKRALYTINAPITANTPVLSGALTGSFSITPAATNLPAGLSFSTTTGAISGTPTAVASNVQFIVGATVGGVASADTITIAVTAGDPPAAPTTVAATRGNRQVTVTWAAPLIVGSAAISGYKAMAVSDTTKFCTTTGALTCTVTGLTNGTSYTFVVRASSAAGGSPLSNASLPVTPAGVPGSPTNVVATGAISLSWTAPASDSGSPIVEYYGASVPAGASCYVGMPAPLTCQVGNVIPATSYTFTVYAVNGVGQGAPSAPSNAVTGLNPGSFVIRVSGSAKPFTFVLPDEALTSADKVTMSIADVYGRTVWSKSVNPKADKVKEVTWNGKASNGLSVSAGMYVVKISTVSGGKTREFTRKAVSVKSL
jgi:hypothetical protein